MALGLDGIRHIGVEFRRPKRQQDVLVAWYHEAVRRQLEGIDLFKAGAIFLDDLTCRVRRACARELNLHERIFLLEPVEQRLDLRARGVEEQAALAPCAVLEPLLAIGTSVVGNRLDARRLGVGLPDAKQAGEHDQAHVPAWMNRHVVFPTPEVIRNGSRETGGLSSAVTL
jgi:hypothetical protein